MLEQLRDTRLKKSYFPIVFISLFVAITSLLGMLILTCSVNQRKLMFDDTSQNALINVLSS